MLVRLLEAYHPESNALRVKDKTVGEYEVAWGGQAPKVALLNSHVWLYAFTIHEDGDTPSNGKVWNCYREVVAVDISQSNNTFVPGE